MSISFTGLASGLDVNSIIDQLMSIERRPLDILNQQKSDLEVSRTYVDNIESRVRTLGTSIQKFTDGNITASMDLFKKKVASSSDSGIVSVTAGVNAVNQTFDINVLNIASSTKVQSNGSGAPSGDVGNVITGATNVTDLSNGTGTAGKFTVFYNGAATEITVLSTDTVQDVLDNITADTAGNITATLAGGVVTLTSAGQPIAVGANGDTSNFLTATQLDIGTPVGNNIISANQVSAIKTSGTIMGTANLQGAGAIVAGQITVGGAQFNIDATTTLDSLLRDINNSADADVSASYNLRTNKIEFASKDPGKVAITLDDGGTNFLDAVNVITPGNSLAYQTLGDNAKFQINGGPIIESTSNTVGDSITGIKDVTLNLLAGSSGSDITITVQNNTEELASAVEKFVADFNNTIKYIDEQTNIKTGKLPADPSLVRFRNNLRTTITNMVQNSPLVSLASVGITTGTVGQAGDPTSQLSFDKNKFLDELQENPDDVRALFIGDTQAPAVVGIMQDLEAFTDSALDAVNGFFVTRDQAITNRLSDIDKSIARAQDRLDSKEKLLKQQFAAMESAISKLQSQSSALTGQSQQLQSSG